MIYAVVVIYNKKCEESETIRTIFEYKNKISIIIFDNSEIANENRYFCEKNKFDYYGWGENIGISKAYNFCVNHCNRTDDDYVIILDDDTLLTKEYFEEANSISTGKEVDVALPIVMAGNILFSPSNVRFGCTTQIVSNRNQLDLNNITAINSGIMVRSKVLKKIKYNEKLFIDNVDHDFMRQVRDNKYKIYVMNSTIYQNYSNFERTSIESAAKRFGMFKKDYKIFCKDAHRMLFYYAFMLKHTTQLAIKYHSFRFFSQLFHN